MTNEQLVTKIQAGETALMSTLWERVERLIKLLANKFYNSHKERCISVGVEFDDLFQQGYFALLVAVEAYDSSKGYKFSTYLNYNLKNAFNDIAKMRSANWKAIKEPISLDVPIGYSKNDDSRLLSDLLPDIGAEAQIEKIIEQDYIEQLRNDLYKAMRNKLNKTQYHIIEQVYFNGLTHKAVAETVGVTRTQELHESALRALARDKQLRTYRKNEIIDRYGHGFGFRTFKRLGISPQERAILELEKRGLL